MTKCVVSGCPCGGFSCDDKYIPASAQEFCDELAFKEMPQHGYKLVGINKLLFWKMDNYIVPANKESREWWNSL